METTEKSRYKKTFSIINEKIQDIHVKGKITFIILDTKVVRIHYGMEGNLIFVKGPHSDLWFTLVKRTLSTDLTMTVYFNDTRHFGSVEIIPTDVNNDIGPDIFYVTPDDFVCAVKKSLNGKRDICQVLLDQNVISGIGNYLKAEILYAACVYPGATRLNDNVLHNLHKIAQDICNQSYESQGCSLRTYKDSLGNPGKFVLKIYDNPKATKAIFKDKRTTHYDPVLQTTGLDTK